MTTTNAKIQRRKVDGILLLDKPLGVSSNTILQTIKRLFAAEKAGHTGSLDPLATGMLPICFGEATKFSQHLLEADKHYLVTAKLGIKTTTADCEGSVVEELPVPNLNAQQLEHYLSSFKGEIEQTPSMFSALKFQGQPLYKLARKGVEIERAPRTIQIHQIIITKLELPFFQLEVQCSKGTYIRNLIEDIGNAIGCNAHVTELRRLGSGPFAAHQMHCYDSLRAIVETQNVEALDQFLLPIDSALNNWPEVTVSDAALYYLSRGQAVILPYAPSKGWVRLKHRNNSFLGIAEILSDGKVAPRRMVQQG